MDEGVNDPNWTPKEPKRPFQPKLGGFSTSRAFPKAETEKIIDKIQVEKLMEEINGNYIHDSPPLFASALMHRVHLSSINRSIPHPCRGIMPHRAVRYLTSDSFVFSPMSTAWVFHPLCPASFPWAVTLGLGLVVSHSILEVLGG